MKKIIEPKLTIYEQIDINECLNEQIFSNVKVTGILKDFKPYSVHDLTIDSCHFIKIDFSVLDIKNVFLLDCIFENCDLSNLEFEKINITRCKFINCKLTGTNFLTCSLRHLSFINSTCRYINFCENKMEDIQIIESDCSNGRFLINQFKNFVLDKVNFQAVEFMKCSLVDTDFSTCNIEQIHIDFDSLKGIIVDEIQAIMLSPLLGIKIKD